jgi:hypothetical protein
MFSWTHNDAELTAEFMRLLDEQGARQVGNIGQRSAVVLFASAYWALTDNGGELIVDKINSDGLHPHIPYTSDAFTMTTMTMVYRVLRALKGEPIDYDLVIDFGSPIYA